MINLEHGYFIYKAISLSPVLRNHKIISIIIEEYYYDEKTHSIPCISNLSSFDILL